MKTGNILLGTLAGIAIGAIAGILFAPGKGSETRNQIRDEGNNYVDKIKSKFDEFRDSFAEKVGSTKNDAENLVDKGRAKFEDTKKDVKKAANFKHDAAASKFSYNSQ